MNFPQLHDYSPLINEIDDCILNGSTWNNLHHDDLEMFAGHVIQSLGHDSYICISESDDCDVIMDMLAKQMFARKRTSDLSEKLSEIAVTYFHDDIKELFKYREAVLKQQSMIEAGLHLNQDQQTGELEWSRTY